MRLIYLVGPTAAGKSRLALRWAKKLGATIANCDSVQCYQGLEIGSAKPSYEELEQVPHVLYSFVPEGESISVGVYYRRACTELERLALAGTPWVIVVGGTGFYVQALQKGLLPISAADPQIQKSLWQRVEQGEQLWPELYACDPESAKRIAPADHYRITRALEVLLTTGKSLTQWEREHRENPKKLPWASLTFGVDSGELSRRIERRTLQMLQLGWVGEVQALMERWGDKWGALNSVGYREIKEFLLQGGKLIPGEKPPSVLVEAIHQATRQLAKRQRTWFRRDKSLVWLSSEDDDSRLDRVLEETLGKMP